MQTALVELIHKATVIQRWNDHIRPFTGFTEIDKQAHKTFYAYALAKCQEDAGGKVDFLRLAEGIIFEFLHRIILTDIKPPIYHRLSSEMGDKIHSWVECELKDVIGDIGGSFAEKFHAYYFDDQYSALEKSIIKFAHYLATKWEFDIIYPMNISLFQIEKVRQEINASLAGCKWFEGKKVFYQNPGIAEFLNMIGQLRFQQRWTATARIPETSVIGHTLVVAILSYLFTLETNGCPQRCIHNFFGGLFHDLPEVLTRDIISPVKRGVEGLEEILKGIEKNQMEDVIYPLLPPGWISDIAYYTMDEFCSKVVIDGSVVKTTSDEINDKYNHNLFSPVDGQIIRACDHISAFMEALLSIQNGVEAQPLLAAMKKLRQNYSGVVIAGIDFGAIFQSLTV